MLQSYRRAIIICLEFIIFLQNIQKYELKLTKFQKLSKKYYSLIISKFQII